MEKISALERPAKAGRAKAGRGRKAKSQNPDFLEKKFEFRPKGTAEWPNVAIENQIPEERRMVMKKIALVGVPVQIIVEVYEHWREKSSGTSEAFASFIQNFDGLEVEAEEENDSDESENVRLFVTDLSLISAAMAQRCQDVGLWLSEAFSTNKNIILLGEGDVA